MFYGAVCRQVDIGGETMNYIAFGKGSKTLVLLPGLGEGLSPVQGRFQAIALAMTYRQFAGDFRVYLFGRKDRLKEGYSTRDMARDQAGAMKALGISKAHVMGVSQGGMIAQYLAIDYPDLVERLVLAVTLSRQNETVREVVGRWTEMAERGDYKSLIVNTAEKSYSEKYLKRHRFLYPLLGKIGVPDSFERFRIQAAACIEHNAYPELEKIACPTLVVGGDDDQIVGANASVELAEKIKDSELFLYHGLGHAAYEEAADFNERVRKFLVG